MAPAVHVAVADGFGVHQAADFDQLVDDVLVGLEDELATEELQRLDVHTVALHRADDVVVGQAILFADIEVVYAIGRRAVNDTRARTQLDVVSQVDWRQAVVKRMAEVDQFQRLTGGGRDDGAFQLVTGQTAFDQFGGQYQQLVADIDQRVFEFRVNIQRLVGGDRPRRGGPDHDGCRLAQRRHAERGCQLCFVGNRKRYVDGRGLLVLILDFGFSQCRAAIETPVDRLEALEDETTLDHLGQRADFSGFVGEVHGQVRIAPVAEHAQTDEFGLLAFDLLGRIGAAQLARTVCGEVLAVGHFDFVLDRQTMTVPTRHIGGIEARQGLGTQDHVLENLVDRMTDVNIAVGVRRTVVQDELGTILANLAQLLVQANAVPALQSLRLALGQAGLHREGGVRKV